MNNHVATGALAKKEDIHWRAPGDEVLPQPKDGEVIVFTDHLGRGFSPPGSKKFRDVLHFLQLHPQDIGPNSVSNICNFQVFCEAYLQEEPTVDLFREFYYLNHQTEFVDGPCQELGGVIIQKRKDVSFPHAKLHIHTKDWNQTWFYVQDTSPSGKILCRVTESTSLTTTIHSPNVLMQRNGPSMHLPSQNSGPLWPTA